MDIKLLAPDDWRVLRNVRLRALRDSPKAFVADRVTEESWTATQWRQRLGAATWVVALESGSIVGLAGLFDKQQYDGWHIESIWVEPAHRRLGIFRTLLTTLADRERGNGARDFALWVLEDNHDARQAYARVGFVPTGERQRLPSGRYELRLRLALIPSPS